MLLWGLLNSTTIKCSNVNREQDLHEQKKAQYIFWRTSRLLRRKTSQVFPLSQIIALNINHCRNREKGLTYEIEKNSILNNLQQRKLVFMPNTSSSRCSMWLQTQAFIHAQLNQVFLREKKIPLVKYCGLMSIVPAPSEDQN